MLGSQVAWKLGSKYESRNWDTRKLGSQEISKVGSYVARELEQLGSRSIGTNYTIIFAVQCSKVQCLRFTYRAHSAQKHPFSCKIIKDFVWLVMVCLLSYFLCFMFLTQTKVDSFDMYFGERANSKQDLRNHLNTNHLFYTQCFVNNLFY